MNAIKEKSKDGLQDFFTVETTKTFQMDMDRALKTMEPTEVLRVLLKYDIASKPEVKDFLEIYSQMMGGWQKENQGSKVASEVTTSKSRCSACFLGKCMTVYEFEYKHSKAHVPYNRVIYQYDFGMMYDVRDGILHDLTICNSFLSKAELQELNTPC